MRMKISERREKRLETFEKIKAQPNSSINYAYYFL